MARIKIMCNLDIAERRLPQDGRIVFKQYNKKNIDVDLRVSTAPLAGAMEVIVEDVGPGLLDDLRPRLFSPFTTGRAAGTGLGLHISRSLAEEAGGALDLLENAPGARFRLRLPVPP